MMMLDPGGGISADPYTDRDPVKLPGRPRPGQIRTRRLAFFRGARFSAAVGDTDWRVGLYTPRFGFETWVFGQGAAKPADSPGVHFVTVLPSRLPLLCTLGLALDYARTARQVGPDAIVCNPGAALAGFLYKRAHPSTKLVLDIRSVPVESHGITGFFQRCYFELALRSSCYDGVTVITAGMLDDLDCKHHLSSRFPVAVWGSGYDHELFIPTVAGTEIRKKLGLEGRFVIMYHGTLSPTRGLDQVLCGVREICADCTREIAVLFVGRGDGKRSLANLAKALDLGALVRFVEAVPHTEIPNYVAAADLGILPLPDHPWWRHQSSIKIYEYLAMGKPVIATDIPCHRDISDAVLLVANNDPVELAEAINAYIGSPPDYRRDLSAKAVTDSRRHTWEAKATILSRFLLEVIGV